jgi:hypothetical protein
MSTHGMATHPMDLREFDAQFKEARREATTGEPAQLDGIPDGVYRAVIEDARLTRSRNGNAMLVWRLRIVSLPLDGHVLIKYRAITDRTLPYVKEDLRRCGLRLERISEVAEYLKEMMGLEVDVRKVASETGPPGVYFLEPPEDSAD